MTLETNLDAIKIESPERSKLIRLVDYLTRLASLRSKTIHDISDYEHTLWISSIPHEKGCFTQAWGRDEEFDSDVWVEIQNQREPELPSVPEKCEDWVERSSLRNKEDLPELLPKITIEVDNPNREEGSDKPEYIWRTELLQDHPEVRQAWDRYVEGQWLPWMEEHNRWESIHGVYSALFAIHQEQIRLGEEYELVLGLGLLTWKTPNGQRVCRHLIVANSLLEFEARLGKFTVGPMSDGADVRPELDMLDIEERPARAEETAKASLSESTDNPWEKDCVEGVLQALVHSINPQGEYGDTLEKKGVRASDKPVVEYSPALMLRKRSGKGLTEALKIIKDGIEQGGEIPPEFGDLAEIRPRRDQDSDDNPPDGNSELDGEVFFPKPSNEEQRRIVDKIRAASGVLVQGPPGTGKSHTIANLICHLLATGQRTLITAKTPRALQVLEGLVPEELRPLCINLLGSGLEERRSLETSVGGILRKNEEWNEDRAEQERTDFEKQLRNLREEQAKFDRKLRDIRESETHTKTVNETYKGTAARIAEAVERDRCEYDWLIDDVPLNKSCLVTVDDMQKVIRILRETTPERQQELSQKWPGPDSLQSPGDFTKRVRQWNKALEDEKTAQESLPIIKQWRLKKARASKRECEEELQCCEDEVLLHESSHEQTHPVYHDLIRAIRERDIDAYANAINQVKSLTHDRNWLRKVDEWLNKIGNVLPEMAAGLKQSPGDASWDHRVQQIQNAWRWAQARYWVEEYIQKEDVPALAQRAKQIEDEINTTIAKLASLHAWSFCFSRLEEGHRRHMEAWQQSMRRLGKGTGKHAPRHRREAQQHLNECREAVPAWVMPLHRVWDTIEPAPGMFDLIIVDEASQCGVEALPLFYLGKKVLIVGDDKQISPDAVGLPRNAVQQLMNQFLYDFQFASSFDVESSLFDHGKLRYGTRRVTLREHFRCMPEIIRFSNDLCYSDTPLIPLRQYGPDRLPPIEHIFVDGGYREGSSNRVVNKPEADAIVARICEVCESRQYTDKTIGVVVLQGEAQGALIEKQLLELLGAEEMENRRLVCGNPYSFQGDERDIMILSMVAAGNERIGPFTKPADERRFNVAASRARDQMILFHSVSSDGLSPSCLRRRLLEFFQNTTPQEIAGIERDEFERRASQDNRRVVDPPDPFDSWFEVDVALVLIRKHFTVIPQHEVAGKRIDLVVEGGQARLAVECDGDRWHGAEQYEADMQRQRQLERCGWEFFRVSEAAFYSNEEDALTPLWRMLEDRGIVPGGGATTDKNRTPDKHNSDDDNYGDANDNGNVQDGQGPAPGNGAPNTQSRRHPEEVSSQEISDAIINALKKCPNHSCTLHSLTSRVLKEVGVLTRGKPRARFERRVSRMTNSLCEKDRIEKYKAKNERVRLLQKMA